MASTYLYLDTRHAVVPTEPYRADWNLNMRFNENSTTHLQLEQCSFANTVYPVNALYNTLVYEENGAASTTTSILSIKNYTGTQLATELQTRMNADTQESTVYTVTYDSQLKKISITTSGNDFRILSSSSCLEILGLSEENGMLSTTTSITFPYTVRLDGPDYLDVVSNLSSRNINSDGKTNVIARIYITAPFGTLNTFENKSDSRMIFYADELSTLQLRLFDPKGNLYVLSENTNVSYTIRLSFS